MKKVLLLLVSLGLLGGLSACGNNEQQGGGEEDIPDVPIDDNIHANTISGDPTQPFHLKVNESRKLKVSLDPSPTLDSERTFTWSSSNDEIAEVVMGEKETEATVTGKAAGNATIYARNKYNSNLVRTFDVKVIDFDEANNYLWEYATEDRAQFGYSSENKQGNKTGVAKLNGLNWTFQRDETNSLQSANGGVGFGKGKEPENVHLEADTFRKIKGIVIEAASTNALANMTVKVGETEVMNCSVPKPSYNHCSEISALNLENLEGTISIDFVTPKYDYSREGDDTYIEPGAVYIKSIWLMYEAVSFDFVTEKTYDFAALYTDKTSVLYKENLPASTGKEIILEDDDFVIKFAKVLKEDKIPGYARTNSDIEIKSKKNSEVIKQVEFKYENGSTANKYEVYSSILGGVPYDHTEGIGNEAGVFATIYRDNVNAANLHATKTNYIGLKSLTVKTVAGEHAVIDSIAFDEEAKPAKVAYEFGDLFDPTGLGFATVKFTNSEIKNAKLSTDAFIYYDGTSYDEKPDHSSKKLELSDKSTYVVAVYQDYEIQIDGITVTITYQTFNKVASVEDLISGEYLFVIPAKKSYWKGSLANADMKKADSILSLGDVEVNDSMELPKVFLKETLTITNASGVISITNKNGGKLGMTEKGEFSIAANPANSAWSVTVADGFVDFVITGGENTKHLVFTTKFDLGASKSSNISLYKIGE